MAINRFNKTANSRVISQFAPQNLNLIAKVLADKQQRYDLQEAKNEAKQEQFSKLSGYGEADSSILDIKGKELNALAEEFSNQDLSDSRISKELRTRTRAIINDPLVMRTQKTLAAAQAHAKAVEISRSKGEYETYNDPFLQQAANYKGVENGDTLNFSGIIKGVNEHDEASKYFDNMSQSGKKQFAQIGESFKTIGWQGITRAHTNEVVRNSLNSFSQGAAGKQALRRYAELKSQGRVPTFIDPKTKEEVEVTPEQYLTSILSTSAREREGVVSTSGQAVQINPTTGQPMQGGRSSIGTGLGVKFTSPQAKVFSDANPDFENGTLEGDGNTSWTELFNGKNFSDIWNDNSLSPEQKETFLPATILSKVHGVSNEEAVKSFDKAIAPVVNDYTKKQRDNIEDGFFIKGAGAFKSYTTYDEAGNKSTGQQVFEELGLVNEDGVFDPEIAKTKGVVVRGEVQQGTGPTANGLYVSTAQGDYIFEQPSTNQEQIQFEMGQAQLDGIVKMTRGKYAGKYLVKDPKTDTFGVWNMDTNQIDH